MSFLWRTVPVFNRVSLWGASNAFCHSIGRRCTHRPIVFLSEAGYPQCNRLPFRRWLPQLLLDADYPDATRLNLNDALYPQYTSLPHSRKLLAVRLTSVQYSLPFKLMTQLGLCSRSPVISLLCPWPSGAHIPTDVACARIYAQPNRRLSRAKCMCWKSERRHARAQTSVSVRPAIVLFCSISVAYSRRVISHHAT